MATSSKIWTLKSSDNETFEVDEAVAFESLTIKRMAGHFTGQSVPVANVDGNILTKVIKYCTKHAETPSDADADARTKLEKFDTEFVKRDRNDLFELAVAANYLEIPGLLDLVCKAIADNIQDMKTEKIREVFNIKNDFTEEEEEALRREDEWAYDL